MVRKNAIKRHFGEKRKRDNDVLMWNISQDWALIMRIIKLYSYDLFSPSFFKKKKYTRSKT